MVLVLGVLALAAVLVPAALAARVHLRVEGKTATIFGAAEPSAEAANPLAALEVASLAGEFYYHLATSSFGNYVDQIGRYGATGSSGWVFKVNGELPPVGADKVELRDGDTVLWYYADFSSGSSGPPTLVLRRLPNGCYGVTRQDDAGKTAPATGAVLQVDGRRVATRNARGCLKGRHGLVRAALPGTIRSQALR